MKINTFLYIVIISLLIYVLFIRNIVSGYMSQDKKNAYKAGYDDFTESKPIDQGTLKTARYGLADAYKKGWNDAKQVNDMNIKLKSVTEQNRLNKKMKEVRSNMPSSSM